MQDFEEILGKGSVPQTAANTPHLVLARTGLDDTILIANV